MDKALFQTYQSYLKWERLAAEWEALKNSSDPYLADLQEEVFKGLNAPLEASLGAETSLMDAYLKEGSSEDPSEQLGALIAFGREQTEARLRRELNLRLEGETQDLRTARYFMEETEARSALTGEILKSYPSLDYGYHREAAREINEMRGELKKGNLFSTAQHYLYGRDALTREAVYSDGREAFKNYEVETKIKGLGIVIAAAAVSHAAAGAAILAGAAAPEAAATFIAPLGFTGTTRAFHGRLWNPDLSTAGNIGDWVVDYALTASMFKYLGVVTRGLAGESGGVLARYAAESAGFATYTPMENVVHQAIAGHGFDEQLFLDQTASPQALLDQQLMLLGLKAGGYPLRLTMRPLDRAVQNEVVQRHWQRYLDALEKGGENVSGLRGLRLAPIAGGSGRPPALPAQVLLPQTRIWFERLRGELQEVEKEALAEAKALEEGMGKDAALRARVASTHRAAAAQKFLLSNSNRPTVGEIVMALQAHPGDPVPFLVLAALTAQGNSLAGDVLLGQARRGNAEAARALDAIDFTQTEEMVTERLLQDPRMVELLFDLTAWGHTKSFFRILELTDSHPKTEHLKEKFKSLPVDHLRQRLEEEGDAEIGRLLYMLWDFFGNEGARDVMAQADLTVFLKKYDPVIGRDVLESFSEEGNPSAVRYALNAVREGRRVPAGIPPPIGGGSGTPGAGEELKTLDWTPLEPEKVLTPGVREIAVADSGDKVGLFILGNGDRPLNGTTEAEVIAGGGRSGRIKIVVGRGGKIELVDNVNVQPFQTGGKIHLSPEEILKAVRAWAGAYNQKRNNEPWPPDFFQKLLEGVRHPELKRLMDKQREWLEGDELSVEQWVVLFEDVFGQLYNAAEGAAEGEGATWPLEAFAELVTIMLKAEENGVHFPKLDRLREQALALAARAPRPESSTRGPEPVLRDPDAGSGNNWAGPIGDLAGILLAGAKRLMGIKSRPEAKPEATPPPRQPQDAQILSWTRHERALLETLYQHIRAIENLRKTGIEKHGALRDAIDQGDPLRLLQVLASLPDIAWNLTPWREDMGESRYVNSQRYDPQYRVFVATLYLKVRRGMQRGEVAISEAALEQLTEAAGSSLREAEEIAQGRQQSEAQSEPPQQQNRFPKAAAFFAERYPGISFSPDRPREMLKLLVHPREEVWVQGKYVKVDPVGKPGYAEAVRELAQAVMPEYAAGKEDGEYEFNPLPFGTLEALTPTPLVEKELRRLLAGSRDVIGQRLARWRENGNGESGTQTPSAPGTSPGTHFMVYDRAVRGGRESGVNKRQSEPSMDGWDWGAREELGYGPVGRLYIGVRADAADTFWAAFKSEVLDLAEQKGTPCQSKISQSRRRLEAAGDNTVLYFRAEDEMFFYNVVVQFMRRHEGAGWFHTLEMDRRPILAAQVFDSQGRPVAGLSFGQHPGPQRSFNGVRADAVARALRQERLLDVLGQFDYFSPRERLRFRMQLILREFQREGIDIENPAFQRDGRKNFPTIYKRTDQGGAQSGPASLAVRLDPEAGSGNSGGGPIGDLVEVLWYGAKRLFGIKPKSQEAPRWNIPALVRSLEAVDPELKARRGIGWGSFPAAKKINEADFLGLLEMELSATSGAIQQEGADLGTVRMDWSKVTPKTRQRAQVVLGMMQMALTAGEDVREGKQGVADDYQLVKDCVDRFPPPKPEEAASIPSGNGNKSVAGVTEDPKIPPPPRLLAPLGASYQSPALPQMEVITLGRNPDSIVSLTDERVSKRHARIFLNANKRWVLEDLRSKNGTFVNDQAIDRPTVLKDGDVIRIGPYEWTVGNGMDNEAGSAEMRGLKPQGPMARPVPTPSPSAVDAPRAEPVTLKILGNPPEGTFVNPVVRIQTQAGEAAATSDPGRGGKEKGKPDNEDGAALVQGPSGNLHLAIFDGMGGYDDADMATRLGIEAFARSASAGGSSEEALREADRQIRGYNEAQSVLERHPVEAGAVAAAAMITPEGVLTVHWAGDARVVVLRPGEDGRYRLIFRTLDETKGAHAVQEGNSPLTQAVIEETDHSVRSNLGDFYGRVHLRGTKQGLVPDDSEAGFRFAEELKGGMLLEEGDIVIGGSDGLWGNLPQNKGRLEVELNDILGPSHSPDSGTKGLRGEIHHRMELYRQGYLAIKEAAAAAGVDDGFYRAPITYKGTSTYLKAQSRLFIDEYGNVWDSPSGGNVVDSFALDHFSVFVHEQGPR